MTLHPKVWIEIGRYMNYLLKWADLVKKQNIQDCTYFFKLFDRYDIPGPDHIRFKECFDKLLHHIDEKYNHVKLLDINHLSRNCYTKQGLHLSYSGKLEIRNIISNEVCSLNILENTLGDNFSSNLENLTELQQIWRMIISSNKTSMTLLKVNFTYRH